MRKSNWPRLLHEYIDSRRNTKHAWGKSDCALFVADALIEITGEDHAKEIRGKYRTKKGSIKVLKKMGYSSIDEYVDDRFEEIDKATAMKGDIVSITQNSHISLGICIGHMAAYAGDEGLVFLPMDMAVRVWRIS